MWPNFGHFVVSGLSVLKNDRLLHTAADVQKTKEKPRLKLVSPVGSVPPSLSTVEFVAHSHYKETLETLLRST